MPGTATLRSACWPTRSSSSRASCNEEGARKKGISESGPIPLTV
jgi:hypothetical protein